MTVTRFPRPFRPAVPLKPYVGDMERCRDAVAETGIAQCPACDRPHPAVGSHAWRMPPRCINCGHFLIVPNAHG